MDNTIIIVLAFAIGVVTAFILFRNTGNTTGKKTRTTKASKEKKQMETAKKVVWVCLFNGFAWVWCSYVLAYLDKPQIAENLSQVAVTEIIGTVLVYCVKSAIENLSKNNQWPDKPATLETTSTDSSDNVG